jgi:protein-disulfide isomerase
VALLVAVSLPANGGTVNKAEVEAIVADYISNNGEAIQASLVAANARAQSKIAQGMINANTPTRGPANAKVTIIEFGEFECPFCARVQPTLKQLAAEYKGQVRFAFKQLPLPMHAQAIPAAKAALAAHQQGKFWEYSDALWPNARDLGDALYVKIATDLNLNLKKFNTDRASPQIAAMIEQDLADAAKAEVRGTPFFYINGTPISGAMPAEEFRKVIDAALKAAP